MLGNGSGPTPSAPAKPKKPAKKAAKAPAEGDGAAGATADAPPAEELLQERIAAIRKAPALTTDGPVLVPFPFGLFRVFACNC